MARTTRRSVARVFLRVRLRSALPALLLLCWACVSPSASPAEVTIVQDGRAVAGVYSYGDAKDAVADLAANVEKISGAALAVKQVAAGEKPPAGAPAVVVGRMALDLGLPAPPKTISGDGYRIQVTGDRVLLAGENERYAFGESAGEVACLENGPGTTCRFHRSPVFMLCG